MFGRIDGNKIRALEAGRNSDALIKILRSKPPPWRSLSAEALGRIGDPKAIDALVDALDDERSYHAAAEALMAFKDDSRVLDAFVRCLRTPDHPARHRAAEKLGELGQAAAVSHLGDVLVTARSEPGQRPITLRMEIVKSLEKLGGEEAVDALLTGLVDPADTVREWAASALGHLDARRARDALVGLLSDESNKVRTYAEFALEKWVPKDELKRLKVKGMRDTRLQVPALPVSFA